MRIRFNLDILSDIVLLFNAFTIKYPNSEELGRLTVGKTTDFILGKKGNPQLETKNLAPVAQWLRRQTSNL